MFCWTPLGNGALLSVTEAAGERLRTGPRGLLTWAGSRWCDDGVAYLRGPLCRDRKQSPAHAPTSQNVPSSRPGKMLLGFPGHAAALVSRSTLFHGLRCAVIDGRSGPTRAGVSRFRFPTTL